MLPWCGIKRHCKSASLAVLGMDHPYTAMSYNNIGAALDSNGDYDAALEQYRKALQIRQSVLGMDHPVTASSYNNIGLVLWKQGNNDAALVQHRKALHFRESVFGTDHLDTASSYNNIGNVLHSKGDYDAALVQYRRALQIRESVWEWTIPIRPRPTTTLALCFTTKATTMPPWRSFKRHCLYLNQSLVWAIRTLHVSAKSHPSGR